MNPKENHDLKELFKAILAQGISLRMRVTGTSMIPFLKHGDEVTINPNVNKKFKRGDLVFFKSFDDNLVLHRIIFFKKKYNFFYIKGDSLPYCDSIPARNLLGKVISVTFKKPLLGFKKADMTSLFWSTLNYLIAAYNLIWLLGAKFISRLSAK